MRACVSEREVVIEAKWFVTYFEPHFSIISNFSLRSVTKWEITLPPSSNSCRKIKRRNWRLVLEQENCFINRLFQNVERFFSYYKNWYILISTYTCDTGDHILINKETVLQEHTGQGIWVAWGIDKFCGGLYHLVLLAPKTSHFNLIRLDASAHETDS